ncbi:MAG: DUF2169 domain-containing protein [Planctomycetes bacterium]|nr:DUF2169 domain-containing protein [Planctomycetota bacterium]
MQIIDDTPFATLCFESLSPGGQPLQIAVVRATFAIDDGAALRPLPEQQPVVVADTYFGEPGTSSLRLPNDLAPHKPNADVVVNATAYAPQGRPCREWSVSVRVGALHQELAVTGPRRFERSLFGWRLTRPEPCTEVPVRYENAFGGQWTDGDETVAWEHNPIGCGFASPRHLPRDVGTLAAPQVLPLQHEPALGDSGLTLGLGALPPAWQPRRRRAGTFDAQWQAQRAPLLPGDFHAAFYNAASPGLTYPGYLRGGEAVCLRGLWRGGDLRFSLPHFELALVATDTAGRRCAALAELDTLCIEPDSQRAYLVWRAGVPWAQDRIAELHLRMREAPA